METIGPVVASSTPILPGVISNIEVDGGYAYLAARQAGLRIWDISNPGWPVETGYYSPENQPPAYFVRVQGNYAYLLQGNNQLTILDVTDRAHPSMVSTSYISGTAFRFDVMGDYLYVAGGNLAVWDVTNKAAPSAVGSLSFSGYEDINDVIVEGTFAYLQDGMKGLVIANISDPVHPALAGTYEKAWTGDGISKSGNYIYAANWRGGMEIIDVSIPAQPQAVNGINPGGDSIEIVTDSHYAYIACDLIGLCVIDISSPNTPTNFGYYKLKPNGMVNSVIQQGSYLYFTKSENGLGIIDLGDPEFREISSYPAYDDNRFVYHTRFLAINGDYAYLGQCDQIEILNISNPISITPEGSFPLLAGSGCNYLMSHQGSTLFILDNSNKQLQLIDVSLPISPTTTSYYPFGLSSASEMVVQNEFIYIKSSAGLHILENSGTTLHEIGFFANSNYGPPGLAVTDKFAYVSRSATVDLPIDVIDIGDKAHPKLVKSISTSSSLRMYIRDNILFTNAFYRMRAYDITIGSNPELIVEIPMPDSDAPSLAMTDTHIFLANSQAGVVIVPTEGRIKPLERIYLPLLVR